MDTADLRGSSDVPLTSQDRQTFVWGFPLAISWWNCPERDPRLNEYSPEGQFAAEVAIALAQLEVWEKNSVEVKKRSWVDIGGYHGYYSVALKLLGADRVCLLDVAPPPAYAKTILDAVGVECLTGDGNVANFSDADSALVLYVPEVDVFKVVRNCSGLTQLIVESDWEFGIGPPRLHEQLNWQQKYILCGEPSAHGKADLSSNSVSFLWGSRADELVRAAVAPRYLKIGELIGEPSASS